MRLVKNHQQGLLTAPHGEVIAQNSASCTNPSIVPTTDPKTSAGTAETSTSGGLGRSRAADPLDEKLVESPSIFPERSRCPGRLERT